MPFCMFSASITCLPAVQCTSLSLSVTHSFAWPSVLCTYALFACVSVCNWFSQHGLDHTCDDIVVIKDHRALPEQQLFRRQRLSQVRAIMVHVVPTWGGFQLVPHDSAQSLFAGNRRSAQTGWMQQLALPYRLFQIALHRVLDVPGRDAQRVLPACIRDVIDACCCGLFMTAWLPM